MKPWFSLFLRRMLLIRRDFLTTCTQKSTQGAKLQADATLCGRNERPQNRTDAKPCLSDVYKMSTRAKRKQTDVRLSGRSFFRKKVQIRHNFATTCTQKSTRGAKLQADATFSGRSMVEMLGVLAIIGVLSVGAIAGYSKAMFKYKLNKQAEQLNTVFNAVARNVHSFETCQKLWILQIILSN